MHNLVIPSYFVLLGRSLLSTVVVFSASTLLITFNDNLIISFVISSREFPKDREHAREVGSAADGPSLKPKSVSILIIKYSWLFWPYILVEDRLCVTGIVWLGLAKKQLTASFQFHLSITCKVQKAAALETEFLG